ncbi:hypothetical protein Egran_00804 [Elaphomyces granulatus]|uniref:Uncharacterized protein n=1 Tax=Elaphomyces granulatus TaxID=519963 RepID=A0A232M518_9EURO|nr:hypothetical protein Egran_00804 [Elaphomyces granulatus]
MESWRERRFVPDSDEDDDFDNWESNGQDKEHPGRDEERVTIAKCRQTYSENGGKGTELVSDYVEPQGSVLVPDDVLQGSENEAHPLLLSFIPPLSPELPPLPVRQEQAAQNEVDPFDVPSSPDELQLDYEISNWPAPEPLKGDCCENAHNSLWNDEGSSPLSSPPSSPSSIPSMASMRSQRNDVVDHSASLDDPDSGIGDSPEVLEDLLHELSQPKGRQLRQRNPIQMHPYLLEDARYQNLLKTRGVKPLRMPNNNHHPAHEPPPSEDFQLPPSPTAEQQWETPRDQLTREDPIDRGPKRQKLMHPNGGHRLSKNNSSTLQAVIGNTSLHEQSQTSSIFDIPSSPRSGNLSLVKNSRPPRFRFPPGFKPPTLSTPVTDSKSKPVQKDDESIMLEWTAHDGVQESTHSRTPSNHTTDQESVAEEVARNVTASGSKPAQKDDESIILEWTAHGGMQESTRSRTPSNHTTDQESGADEVARDVTDSGSKPAQKDDESIILAWTAHGGLQESTHSRTPSNHTIDQESGAEELEVERLRRKIKGVLPASWLRLDLKKQEERRLKSTSKPRDTHSLLHPEATKGVARRIRKARNNPGTSTRHENRQILTIDDSDSADESNSAETYARRTLAGLVGFNDPFNNLQDDDIPEDNRIDYMFPSPLQNVGEAVTRKPRTKKHTIERRGNTIRRNATKGSHLSKRQTRIPETMSHQRKRSKPTPKPLRLGILDAPDVSQRPRYDQPNFLRVAARQAWSRRDRGRKSPTNKFLRLGTQLDTADANVSLRDWRNGVLQQARTVHLTQKPQREPLSDITRNGNISNDLCHQGEHIEAAMHSRPKPIDVMDTDSENDLNPTALFTRINAKPQRKSALTKPGLPERRGNKWIVPRKFVISSLKRNAVRPADLEACESGARSPALFRKSLGALNRAYHNSGKANSSLTLDRFLSDTILDPSTVRNASKVQTKGAIGSATLPVPESTRVRQRRVKKRPPNRVDVHAFEHQQSPKHLWADPAVSTVSAEEIQATATPIPNGLGVFRSAYTFDFNISPLGVGTFFHESTFIGSGEFARSLDILRRDLDREAGYSCVRLGERNFRWGAWNDAVSSELGVVLGTLSEDTQKVRVDEHVSPVTDTLFDQIESAYRSIIEYVRDRLFFTDPVDRADFVERASYLVTRLSCHIATLLPITHENLKFGLQSTAFTVILANQIRQISSHELVGSHQRDSCFHIVKQTSRQLMSLIFSPSGLMEIRRFLKNSREQDQVEMGIHNDYPAVEAYIILYHVLYDMPAFKGWFEEISASALLSAFPGDLAAIENIQFLEQIWDIIFTALPLGEIDRFGISNVGSRHQRSHGNWGIVRRLVVKVLGQYENYSTTQPASFNNYCRALFHRCFHLINYWGWRECKIILDTLFDFFAKNTLHNLRNEDSFGSPSFLDRLDNNPSLDVQPGDSCFHIFLKIIGSGLRSMSELSDEKKMRKLAWRLLPNHGRVYPRDRPLRQEDLNALRNHHDLLCTLYWAVPDTSRPRIETIRGLVHPDSSHRETCSLSLRSWTRLVRFKLSTNEDISGLEPFSDWHSYFVSELVKQHSLARTEVESQTSGGFQFSRQLIESTISQNQLQIESLLNTALDGLKVAVESARSLDQARVLTSRMPITRLLGLFNSANPRVNNVVSNTLDVVIFYIQKDDYVPALPVALPSNDDSQEYGDWAGIESFYEMEQGGTQPVTAIQHLETYFHPAVSRLISNCFGEDHCPEDSILLKAINCWSSLAQSLVRHRLRHWDSFLSPYGSDSWISLRATIQTKKFTPQFLANCIEKDSTFYVECKAQVLNLWMSSLIERSSMLKFQHRLTETLLNQNSQDPLLTNLPFCKDRRDNRYHITLSEIGQRRLSLISSLLSNMREHLQEIENAGGSGFSNIREEYRELVVTLMATMKMNYQELGSSTESAQGAYVNLVHCVVEFLQQHVQSICPIDRFFIDPTSFPLPATDPTYIVARMKSYGLRLSNGKTAKQLVMFFQSISERAAMDGEQAYFINQLHTCMADAYEDGNTNKPTLRSFLMQCIFPAYIEHAFNHGAGWILARPILHTISRTFADLFLYLDITDASCTKSITNVFKAIFFPTSRALHSLVSQAGIPEEPAVLMTTAAFLDMISSGLPIVEYMCRSNCLERDIVMQLQLFRRFVIFAVNSLLVPSTVEDPYEWNNPFQDFDYNPGASVDEVTDEVPQFLKDARSFAYRELQTWLHTSWSRHDGRYFLRRGQQHKEIVMDAFLAAESVDPVKTFIQAVKVFLDTFQGLDVFLENDIEFEVEVEHVSELLRDPSSIPNNSIAELLL